MAVNPLMKQRRRGPGRPFEKGQSGNPAGRPAGSPNAATRLAEAMLHDAASDLTRALLKAAFQTAVPRPARTVAVALPEIKTASDLTLAMAAVTRAVAEGELTPYEAGELARLVEAAARLNDIADFASRLETLERLVEEAQREPPKGAAS